MPFKKRRYRSIKEFCSDVGFVLKNSRRLKKLNAQKPVSPAFQERLMLAVTGVNGCRYCSYFHSRQALKSGVSDTEINNLLAGDFKSFDQDEGVALLYAQHWAESNGRPDAEAVARLRQNYGDEKAEVINIMLRMIRLGNLSGNTFDYLINRLTFGKFQG
jgi:AhpD family alkylhydroperoxidase